MENNIKEIRERHIKEITEFQESCPHPEVSNWMQYHWAPGHYSHDVRTCIRCGMILKERGIENVFK